MFVVSNITVGRAEDGTVTATGGNHRCYDPWRVGDGTLTDAVLACPLTFNSVNKFAHGHADSFAMGLLCEMVGYGVPVVDLVRSPAQGGSRRRVEL